MNDIVISELAENIAGFIKQQRGHFAKLNEHCLNRLDFAQECEFAKQQLLRNDYLIGVARSNPDSLHAAISNVAAIGITLNPALQFAYLVPRKINKKDSICLDISYRGLIKLATDTGIIKAMKAELVYENDEFEYHGFHEKPTFKANPFGDRGVLIGVYAMALLTDGNCLVETMSAEEVNQIRDDSEAYKSAKKEGGWRLENNVWVKYYGEMVKKTVIKRAYKTLPTSKGTEILGKAIDVLNEHEGIEFQKNEAELFYTEEERGEYQRCLDNKDYSALYCLERTLSAEGKLQLRDVCLPKPEKGKKGEFHKQFGDALSEGNKEAEYSLSILQQMLDDGEESGAKEIIGESSKWMLNYFESCLNTEQAISFNKILNAS